MTLKIANYTLQAVDNLNFRLTRSVNNSGKVTEQHIGWYKDLMDGVLRIIKDRAMNSDYEGNLTHFLKVYDEICKTTLAEIKNALEGLK